jgi:hypothetical protein
MLRMAVGGDGHGRAGVEFCYFVIHAVTWTLAQLWQDGP